MNRFAIAAGGTGGHLFPGLAVAEVLHSRGCEVMVLTSEKHIDAVATEGRSEFRIERLPGIGMPRGISWEAGRFLFRFARGVLQCRRLFSDFSPRAVLGMGGFTSTAPILAGKMNRLPVFVHESNAIPGKANRLNAFLCNGLLAGFSDFQRDTVRVPVTVTGTPVRSALLEAPSRTEALQSFGLEPGYPTVLIMGGSQGASGINRVMRDAVRVMTARGGRPIQLIHITGAADEENVRRAYQTQGRRAWVGAFHHQMQNAYAAADLAVARSGAASLTELAHFGVPSILIPYPHAAEDHQTRNAEIFVKAGAAEMMAEASAEPESLANRMELILDQDRHKAMAGAALSLSNTRAAEKVADILMDAAKHRRNE
jgi:UDP-N-acetylglucosamine--N-acetylmuramyl-(pentapeptide) pyrophosphoryl-undecaprenol N-acetylglucosamine transferase